LLYKKYLWAGKAHIGYTVSSRSAIYMLKLKDSEKFTVGIYTTDKNETT